MKLWKWLLAPLLASSFVFAPFQQSLADEEGWGMMIRSPHVGILYLYITSEGFALVVKETSAKFVTHAPDWRLVMYNDKTKVYYVERLSDLQGMTTKGKKAQIVNRAAMQSAKAVKTEVVAGMHATQYRINTYSPEGGQRQAEVWITPSIQPPMQLHKTLEKVFSIDMSSDKFPKGMPLRIKVADEGGKQDVIFDTLNCQRQHIKAASFSYPTTYKRVDSELAVLMDETSRKKMESILDDTDDISTLLGTDTKPARPRSSYTPAGNTSRPPASVYRPAVQPSRPAAAAPIAKPAQQQGDWFGSMIKTLGGGK